MVTRKLVLGANILAVAAACIAACGERRSDESTVRPSQARLEPALHAGDPTCGDLGFDGAIDVNALDVGPFSSGGVSVTISNISSVFDWSATSGISAVIVKGGPDANVYFYDPPSKGATSLHPPENIPQGQGKYWGIARVQFCFASDAGASDGGSDAAPSTDAAGSTDANVGTDTGSDEDAGTCDASAGSDADAGGSDGLPTL